MSAYETRGPGSIPSVGTYFQSVFFFFPFLHFKAELFFRKGHHQNDRNGQPLTFYIKLSLKSMEIGLDLALQTVD